MGADENDRDIAGSGVGFEPAAQLVPIHLRHAHIQQYQIGQVRLDLFQGLGTAGSAARQVPVFGQNVAHQIEHGSLVVDDQDLALGSSWFFHKPLSLPRNNQVRSFCSSRISQPLLNKGRK